jgi:hypothetical protein
MDFSGGPVTRQPVLDSLSSQKDQVAKAPIHISSRVLIRWTNQGSCNTSHQERGESYVPFPTRTDNKVGPLLSDRAKKLLQTLIGFVEVCPTTTCRGFALIE